jgi:hypothetical protein
MIPPWLPNWKDDRAYQPPPQSATQWAWEFLRRRPDYQEDYETHIRQLIAEDGSIGDDGYWAVLLFRERYGVIFPVNPAIQVNDLLFVDRFVSQVINNSSPHPQTVRLKDNEIYIKFDLSTGGAWGFTTLGNAKRRELIGGRAGV